MPVLPACRAIFSPRWLADGWNAGYGCGRVNAYRAVSLATRGADPHTSPVGTVRTHLTAGLNNLLYLGRTRQVATALV